MVRKVWELFVSSVVAVIVVVAMLGATSLIIDLSSDNELKYPDTATVTPKQAVTR